MFEFVVEFIKEYGVWGLLISVALEASSLPFPGGLVTLTFGYFLNPSISELFSYGLLASGVYTIFSFIPYGIGFKLEHKLKEKTNTRKIEKAQNWFKKYGSWSIALTRPIGLGNYISYLAGGSRVKAWKFGLLTFVGIFPWTVTMLWLGNSGNLKAVTSFLGDIQVYLLIGLAVVLIGYFFYRYKKTQQAN
ncbi:DedA family protein [Pseudalkalibacillus berkeleyi]|uniref:VTT domain-containing protein n=1 Tax=Pseudalkalibacillus berkeleyi TaxID=1069813 RepID=A0ABS9GXN6_9BACL|nr:VTT domain-containing protein [Pseudalkalibacillus berkeleyi]MCF6136576.1 VTT domain-containing protein [Pseudalkalibacillus berkeleyi]